MIASALAGHIFNGSKRAAISSWHLSPGSWMYVAWRVDRCEKGWRRRRGLKPLRLIASKRRDQRAPIDRIHCFVPWNGSPRCRNIVRKHFLQLIHQWRHLAYFIHIVKHATFVCTRARAKSLSDVLSSGTSLDALLADASEHQCICDQLLGKKPNLAVCDPQEPQRKGRYLGLRFGDYHYHLQSRMFLLLSEILFGPFGGGAGSRMMVFKSRL